MLATKTIVIAAIITAICVTALVVGIVLGTRSSGCSGDATEPANVTVAYTEAGLMIEWKVPEDDVDCDVSYQLIYNYDLGGQKYNKSVTINGTEELQALISPLAPCVEVEFHIIPINEDGESSDNHHVDTYTVPLETVSSPTDIQFNSEDENNLEITWSSPNVGECSISYFLIIIPDIGEPIEKAVTDESHILPQSSFCLSFNVSIVAIYDPEDGETIESQPATADYYAPGVANIEEQTDQDTLVVSWDAHPKASSCEIQYRVTYTVDGEDEDPIELTTDEDTLIFPTFYYCTPSQLTVTAFVDDSNSMTSSKDVEAVDPETLSPVTDLRVSEEVVISWTTPDIYRKCSVTYILVFTTDIGSWQSSTIENEFQVTTEVPYCFSFNVMVEIRFSESLSSSNNLFTNHREDPVIEDLTIVENGPNIHELLATWEPHPRHDMCSFQYRFQVTVDDAVDYSTELNTATNTFGKTYCAESEVVVTISSPYGTSQKSYTYPVESEDIDEIAGISSIEFAGDTDLVVRWRSPTYRCGETYKVVITADGKAPSQVDDHDDVTHTVLDGDYCFEVEVEVTPILNGEEGSPFSETYESAGVKDIEEKIDGNKRVISWAPHPKAETCALSYRVTYSEAPNPVEVSHSENSATFDTFYYCFESKVTVTAFNADGEMEPTEKIIAAKNPTAIDPVLDLDITDGIILWKISEPYEKCTLTYLLDFTTDISITQTHTTDTAFIVPDSLYCFSFSVQVTARFDEVTVSTGNPSMPYNSEFEIEGLDMVITDTAIEAFWTPHAKIGQCGIEYTAKYSSDGVVETDPTSSTDSTATFETSYCLEGTVTVSAVATEVGTLAPSVQKAHSVIMPTSIGPVRNIQSESETPGEVTITWLPPVDLDRCSLSYDVSITSDDDPSYTDSCSPTGTSCAVDEFCPTMKISISPTIDSLNGPSETGTYTCATNDIPNL